MDQTDIYFLNAIGFCFSLGVFFGGVVFIIDALTYLSKPKRIRRDSCANILLLPLGVILCIAATWLLTQTIS